MSESALQILKPELLAIDDADVKEPEMPMAAILQEAHDLATLLAEDAVFQTLKSVGLKETMRERLLQLLAAARVAQSRWMVMRDRKRDGAQLEREAAGIELRRELMAACRWNLRHVRTARATLNAIAEGTGVADLVQDLNDLAELIGKHQGAFDSDQTFDASAQQEAARSAASLIAAGLSHERQDMDQHAAKSLRDRASTLLSAHLSVIRAAGRYSFREDPKLVSKFSSNYMRRRNRRRRSRQQAAEESLAPPSSPLSPA